MLITCGPRMAFFALHPVSFGDYKDFGDFRFDILTNG